MNSSMQHIKPSILLSLFLLLSLYRLEAQPVLDFPDGIQIVVNDTLYPLQRSFLDSIERAYEDGRFLYHIAGVHFDSRYTFTTLRLPQTLSKSEVLRQIVLYYNFLRKENKRAEERLLIFPFFVPTREPAPISCRYNKGRFFVTIRRWKQVPVPPFPSPEEREIYNQVINHSLKLSSRMDTVEEKVLQAVAGKNNLTLEEVRRIYRNVLLWQRSR